MDGMSDMDMAMAYTPTSIKSELTTSPDLRILRQTLSSNSPTTTNPTNPTIFPTPYPNHQINSSQHVVRSTVNRQVYLSAPVTRTDAYSHILGPNSVQSSHPSSPHVLTHRRQRLRTSNQVFTATHGQIAPHGLPQSLPPAPSTAPTRRITQQQPELPDFNTMSKNYLTMLAQKPTEEADNLDNNNNNNGDATFSPEHMQSIIDVVIKGEYLVDDVDDDVEDQSNPSSPSSASSSSSSSSTSANPTNMLPPPTPQTPELYSSPTFSDIHDFNTYSPETDFLNTPLFEDCGDDMDMGMLTGMYDGTEHGDLFPALEGFSTSSLSSMYEKPSQTNTIPQLPEGLLTLTPESPMLHDFSPTVNPSSLYPTPSPRVPATLDLSSAFASPSTAPLHDFLVAPVIPTTTAPTAAAAHASAAAAAAPPRRRSTATGTRKGVTPGALVPVDAPTQPRKYVLPSSTSRKDLPTIFAKKRSRSVAFPSPSPYDDDPDADDAEADREPPPGPNATEKEQIEYKRRQNTVAARRSRKRKLEYQQGLERDVGRLRREKEAWRVRAEVYRGMLLERGVKVMEFEEMDLEGEEDGE